MKKFLKRLLIFLIFPMLIIAIAVIIILRLNFLNYQLFENFKTNNNVELLIVGDSHSCLAINDSLLPGTLNISQTSESYLFSYYKLQTILKNNPKIKTVLLSCSYHTFSAYYDDYITGNFSTDIVSKYFFILPDSIKWNVITNKHTNIISLSGNLWKYGFNNLKTAPRNYSFLGNYGNFITNIPVNENSITKRVKTQYYNYDKLVNYSEINIQYFFKIVELCKTNNIKLIVINTPMCDSYQNKVPLKFKEKYAAVILQAHLETIAFDSLKLDDSCFQPDGDHVSIKGATLTTDYLRKKLNY